MNLKAVPNARYYELRCASVSAGGVRGTWTSILVASARKAIDGLTPGTTYTFQVRACNSVGCTDWSDGANRMST